MSFTILTPGYVDSSAGVRCLWYLAELMVEAGIDMKILVYTQNFGTIPEKFRPYLITGTTQGIIIAPETFQEIPVPHVRWALNKPGLLGGPTSYPAGTKVFHFSPEIYESASCATPGKQSELFMLANIQLPSLPRRKKTLRAFYRGKCAEQVDMERHENELEMTRAWPPTKQQYWEFLNNLSTLYSYDDFSAVNLEAYLMGVSVMVLQSGIWKPYTPPSYAHSLLMDRVRDIESVKKFATSCLSHFSMV